MNFKKTTLIISAGAVGAVAAAGSSQPASADQADNQNQQQTYTIQAGDTLSQLAQRFQTTTDRLASDNHITNANRIYEGEKLIIQTAAQAAQQPAPATTPSAPATNAASTDTSSNENWQSYFQTAVDQFGQTLSNAANTADATQSSAEDAALKTIIFRESSGNVNATNGIYYGIGQLSPHNRALYGGNSTNYDDQLQAMKAYIHDRYGTATNALAHHDAMGWY